MRVLTFLLLAVVMALGTAYAGWWAVAVLGALWGLVAGWRGAGRGEAALAAAAAAFAWVVLLAIDAAGGRLGGLGRTFGAVAGLPPALFFALTLAFPALLAWSAAALAGAVWPRRARRRRYYVAPSRAMDDRVSVGD